MREHALVAVDSAVKTAGAVTWWRLAGEVNRDALRDSWVVNGLDAQQMPLPVPSEVSVLRYAMSTLAERRLLCRPLGGRGEGYALVREQAAPGGGLVYGTLLTAQALADGTVGFSGGGILSTDEYDALVARVRVEIRRRQENLSVNEVSTMLSSLVARVNAVRLRDTGGIYFVPHEDLHIWQRMIEALSDVSDHKVYELPALQTEKAVEAILAAVEAEAGAAVEQMLGEVGDSGTIGKRALGTKVGRVESLVQKVQKYEALLGASMQGMKDKLENLRGTLTMLALTAPKEGE